MVKKCDKIANGFNKNVENQKTSLISGLKTFVNSSELDEEYDVLTEKRKKLRRDRRARNNTNLAPAPN